MRTRVAPVRAPAPQRHPTRPSVAAASRPPHLAGPAGPLLDLQRKAGNGAVGVVVARVGPPVATPVAATKKTPAEVDALKLGEFNAYANGQADWAQEPSLPAADRVKLIDLLEFARAGRPSPLAACTGFTVHDLVATGLTPDVRAKLRTYSQGEAATDTAGVERTTNLADAQRDGEALAKLEAAIPKAILHLIMGTEPGKPQFKALVAASEIEKFAAYYQKVHPALEAPDGADVTSYLAMVKTDGKNPIDYAATLPHVRNYHRFPAPLLDTLVINEGVTTKTKPLLLILHSGSDHNGAFHRDAGMTALVQNPRNLTIMVEGVASLEAMGGEVATIAKRQGVGDKLGQVMLAGHGSMRDMELTGSQRADGSYRGDGLDLNNNKKRTEKFLKGLIANIAPGPDAHILLNACLTAADEVSGKLSKDPAKAKAQILRSLKNGPSLAARIGQLAPGIGVEGNVSSTGAGTYQSVDGAGTPTGLLHGEVPGDPSATTSNRGEYIELGTEAEGCVRAVVALWALDKTECLARVNARRAKAISGWGDQVVHVVYDLLAASPDDISFINRIANTGIRALSEFNLADEQKPDALAGLVGSLSKAELTKVLGPLYGGASTEAKLAMDGAWMLKDTSRRPLFMALLDGFASGRVVETHLSSGLLALASSALLPVASALAPSTAQAKLALWLVTGGRNDAAARAFLRKGAKASGHVALPAGTTVEGLSGGPTEDDVLITIGLKSGGGGGGGPSSPTANMDTDGDGINDTFVESVTRHGVVTAIKLNLRQGPGMSAKVLDLLASGTQIYVFGRTGSWLAVERPAGGTGFVHERFVRTSAVA